MGVENLVHLDLMFGLSSQNACLEQVLEDLLTQILIEGPVAAHNQ